ncbi:PREDICTED: zinc finger BED domain-containing protein RICESLEEPER 2-like [Erythranthe guttata]|uniref:zinc finger BED domain-containing protein RICESLEEPER 2-like n=1 Tax=Erythranthe guttata TaxID=4155 RepID=UPI00064DE2C2|nr:PREDICTED: zinc finger BED domain-containing protein RICESLEEPER 2-like [Erythranthe guttata]|eukprot:XP_012849436.1 PREDICTED: zinc finger BED domain-containing protein RICESLEEPER 2-like [Erythranthe guttata]
MDHEFVSLLEKIESKSSVCLDIETRWNSTYLMLEAATKFEKAFERMKEDNSNYKIYFKLGDKDDEDNDRDQLIGGEQTSQKRKVTSNLFLQEIVDVHAKLKYLSRHNDPKVSLMGLKMQEKFVKYWESFDKLNLFVYVGTVLDPRYKLRFVTFCLNQVYEDDSAMSSLMEEEVRKVLTRLYEYYKQRTPGQNSENVPSSSSQALFDVMDIDDGLGTGKYLASQFAKQLEKNECVKSKSELARYLEESCEKDVESFDLLRWWKENSIRFPIISEIARDILAISISTVASESAFSTSGRILDPYRSSLNPEMVEALPLKNNMSNLASLSQSQKKTTKKPKVKALSIIQLGVDDGNYKKLPQATTTTNNYSDAFKGIWIRRKIKITKNIKELSDG